VSHCYRSELSKRELADCDFDELIYRGLSAQAIEAIGFKTLTGTMDVPYTKSVKGKPLWLLHGDNYLQENPGVVIDTISVAEFWQKTGHYTLG
jgi:hypothetical protein